MVTTLAGHAWTAPDRWVAVVSDVVHLGAVSVWIGGLVALFAVLPLLGRATRVRLATRFSALALGAVVLVAASGTVSGWQQVRTLDGLTSTSYGRLLLAKVAGFAVLVVLGWLNRARLVPLVERTVGPLRRSLRIELAVAAVVLALTAALIHQPPARTTASDGPFDTTVEAEAGEVLSATVDPAEAGPNDIHLYFTDRVGRAAGRRRGAGHGRDDRRAAPPFAGHPRQHQPCDRRRGVAALARHLDRRGDGRAGGPAPGLHVRGTDLMTTSTRSPPLRLLAAAARPARGRRAGPRPGRRRPPRRTTATPS